MSSQCTFSGDNYVTIVHPPHRQSRLLPHQKTPNISLVTYTASSICQVLYASIKPGGNWPTTVKLLHGGTQRAQLLNLSSFKSEANQELAKDLWSRELATGRLPPCPDTPGAFRTTSRVRTLQPVWPSAANPTQLPSSPARQPTPQAAGDEVHRGAEG